MRYLICILGVIVAYECTAQIVGYFQRHPLLDNLEAESQRNRLRLLNQQGQMPGEIHY